MTAVLRADGRDFNVDEFLDGCMLTACAVKRRGEPVFPKAQPNGRRHKRSGVHLCVSDADFDEFPRQVVEATVFLRTEFEKIRRRARFMCGDCASLAQRNYYVVFSADGD
jgi:hypothetical protein